MARRPSNFVCKVTMATTGVIFAAFVFVHMIGNTKVYSGRFAFDAYASWLREVGYPLIPHHGVLWALRVVLVIALILHVFCGLTLWLRGRKARGPHRRERIALLGNGARIMAPTGLVLLVFIVVHILDLTTGHLGAPSFGASPYSNLIASFSRYPYAMFYVFVMVLLAFHLLQGLWSVLHDFGATASRLRVIWVSLAILIAVGIALVNASIPIAVLGGWLT